MFPAAFEYRRAQSIDDAIAALAEFGEDARILAGGQSLIPAMRYRLARPSALVDINAIGELGYLRERNGFLTIGALARDFALETASLIRERYPLLADTSAVVADPVVRQTGTVVGSLCHNDPAGDWPVTSLAARAEVTLRGPNGSRTVAIDDFIVDSFTTAAGSGEVATEVRFPSPNARTAGSFQKIERKVGDFATASAAAYLTLAPDGTIGKAGIAIGAVGPTALRVAVAETLLEGKKPTKELIREAAREAEKLADPTADNRGSVEFKKAMAGVLAGRAMTAALGRLGVGGLE